MHAKLYIHRQIENNHKNGQISDSMQPTSVVINSLIITKIVIFHSDLIAENLITFYGSDKFNIIKWLNRKYMSQSFQFNY